MAEPVGNVFVGVPGLRKRHHELHPEKPWNGAEGRGFDSRQLHRSLLQRWGPTSPVGPFVIGLGSSPTTANPPTTAIDGAGVEHDRRGRLCVLRHRQS